MIVEISKEYDNPIGTALIKKYTNNLGLLSEKDIYSELFANWTHGVNDLYEFLVLCEKYVDWGNGGQIDKRYLDTFYGMIKSLFDMIGLVNSYPLSLDQSQFYLFTAYAVTHGSDNELLRVASRKREDIFRLRFERYMSRCVIEQMQKSDMMLADDYEDVRLVRRMKTRKKRQINEKETAPIIRDKESVRQKPRIGFTTFVVLCNSFYCCENHTVESVCAEIEIISPNGVTLNETISGGYCSDCDRYFLLESDYALLRKKGILLCQLVTLSNSTNKHVLPNNSFDLSPESVLHRSGYNVSMSNGLTTVQRQEILKRVIDSGIYTKSGLLSFLDWLISRTKKIKKKDMRVPIEKWTDDRNFISHYHSENERKVKVDIIMD